MNRYSELPWNPQFYQQSPMYLPLQKWADNYQGYFHWPGLDDFERQLRLQQPEIMTLNGQALTIVAQDDKPNRFHEHYAPRIYMSGELQTRLHNWHDFFQFLTWMMFPHSKAQINSMHIPLAQQRLESYGDKGRRTPLENALSLFDEGGAFLVSSDASLLDMVRNFRWKELFWHHRDQLIDQFQCIVYGHALYEKGLEPYLGMTANTILFEVEPRFFTANIERQLQIADGLLVDYLKQGMITQPRDLQPFPILGMPGWYPGNESEIFYENAEYFRPGRSR